MSKDTQEPDLSTNKASPASNDHGKNPRASSSSSSSSSALWLKLKDPRIFRVSRAFGGKDRHSKVCTIKGLRDRRVRLSVPTAIQLYDLQDRLGFSQPSKVVDWLLEAAKHEIDELPPLPEGQIPTLGNLAQMIHHQSNKQRLIDNEDDRVYWQDPTSSRTSKSKDFIGGTSHHDNLEDTIQSVNNPSLNYLHSHFEPASNVPSAHNTIIHGFMPQHDQSPQNNSDLNTFSSTLSLSSQPRFSVYHQPSRTQAYFAHHLGAPLEIDPRNVNSFHILPTSASSQNMLSESPSTVMPPPPFSVSPLRPLHLSLDYPKFSSQNDFEAQTSKDERFFIHALERDFERRK